MGELQIKRVKGGKIVKADVAVFVPQPREKKMPRWKVELTRTE